MEVVELLEPALASFTDIDELCTARMLYGTAISRAHDTNQGLEILNAVAALLQCQHADRAIRAELAYYRGLAYWTRRQFSEASKCAIEAERAEVDVLSVRATQLRAFIALSSARYNDALSLFARAREAYGRCTGRDLDLVTQIIWQIAALEMNLRSAEVPGTHADPDGRTIPGTAFGPAVATSARMMLFIADGWLYALDGNRTMAVRSS